MIRGWPTPGKKTKKQKNNEKLRTNRVQTKQTMDSNINRVETGIRENDNMQNHEKVGGGGTEAEQ